MKRNFNEIYQEIYTNGVKELTELKNNHNLSLFIFLVFVILIATLFITQKRFSPILVISIFATILSLVIFIKAQYDYKKGFKELVIKRIVYLYNPEFTYSPADGVSRREYIESFFDTQFDRFYTEDLIKGVINDEYSFKMAQVKTEVEEVERDSDGKSHVEVHTLFSGLFGIVEIKDSMIMKMDITSNNFLNKYNKSRIEVDSSEFEKKYDMFSTDKVRTMEIFTSDIIEEFNKFEEETGYVMQIKVVPNKLYFRISCGESFEAPLVKDALSYDYLYKNFRMIDFPIDIISKMIENALETRR